MIKSIGLILTIYLLSGCQGGSDSVSPPSAQCQNSVYACEPSAAASSAADKVTADSAAAKTAANSQFANSKFGSAKFSP